MNVARMDLVGHKARRSQADGERRAVQHHHARPGNAGVVLRSKSERVINRCRVGRRTNRAAAEDAHGGCENDRSHVVSPSREAWVTSNATARPWLPGRAKIRQIIAQLAKLAPRMTTAGVLPHLAGDWRCGESAVMPKFESKICRASTGVEVLMQPSNERGAR